MPRKQPRPKNKKNRIAPPELTGGAGGGFESSVAAFALVQLLTGSVDLGDDLGRVTHVKFQTKDLGHHFDDIVLEFASLNNEEPRSLAVSSKRDKQVTRNGFCEEIVQSIWRHFTERTFRRHRDSMLLAVGDLANDVQNAWDDLWQEIKTLSGDAERCALRLQRSSAMKQALFHSLQRPVAEKSDQADPNETFQLIEHVRLRLFDFRSAASRDRARGIELCKQSLSGPNDSEPLRLWEKLEVLANTGRQYGGTVDLPSLISALHGFQLREHPAFRADLATLSGHSQKALGLIRTDIAEIASLVRQGPKKNVEEHLASQRAVALIGESGSGKSSLAKQIAFSSSRVVWLSADDLRSGISLQHELADVLEGALERGPLLIIDAAERFDDQASQRCAALLDRLVGSPSPRWRIILTSQPARWEDVANSLIRYGSRQVRWEYIAMEVPDTEEIRHFLTAVPSLRVAFRRPELQQFLRNLKTLDWVVRQVRESSTVNTRGWAGVSDVIDWLWKSWITSGPEHFARANLLKKLATLESEALSLGVPLSNLNSTECQTLSGLIGSQLVRESDERVYFEHDLLADWARLRCLIEDRAHITGALAARSASPRWHRAIQLFGQRLAETDPNGRNWHHCLASNSSTGETLAADLLLDAVCSAVNALPVLETLWPRLADNNGALLTRLLQRFRHLASMPDPRMLTKATDSSQAFWMAANCRVAQGHHWGPMLRFLHAHRADVIRLAPLETANTCKLWLVSTPKLTAKRASFPLRQEAAEILFELARDIQGQKAEGKHFHDDTDAAVFGAMLEAIDELPDKVARLALELCQRRRESRQIAIRRKEASRRQAEKRRRAEDHLPFFHFGPLLEPWPDGPRSRVDGAFREVCLNSNALQRMMALRPSVAREVILALCIESPRRQGSHGYLDSIGVDPCGIDRSEKWNGPIYFRGPFLSFLRIAPKYGIDLIVRLTNFATTQWRDWINRTGAFNPDGPSDSGLSYIDKMVDRDLSVGVMVSGDQTRWLGDLRVYGWHRNRLVGTDILASALMVVEKWLYDEVDAGHPIDRWVNYLLANARSVSILAVLVTLGKKYPELLKSVLRPVLSCWQAYYWDQRVVAEEDSLNMFFFTWSREGEFIYNLARDWTILPHRKQLFVQRGIELLLSESNLQPFFLEVREGWKNQVALARDPTSLNLLIARFDSANYRARSLDSQHIAIELEWPENLKESTAIATEAADANLKLLNFPIRCRKLLDEQTPLAQEMLDPFWQDYRKLPELAAKTTIDEREHLLASALMAGATVLAVLHSDWLREDRSREKWCSEQLRQVTPPLAGRSVFDMPESPSGLFWDSFLGELAVAEMAENPEDRAARAEVARAVMSFHYETAQYTLRAACRMRQRLGEEFQRIQNLALMYAGVSFVVRFRADHALIDDERRNRLAERYRDKLLNAFVNRQVSTNPVSLRPVSEHAYHFADREWRRRFRRQAAASQIETALLDEGRADDALPNTSARALERRRHSGVDIQFLQKAFDWLPFLSDANSEDERRSWIHTHRELLSVTIANIEGFERDERGEINGTPFEYDNWIFAKIASLIAQMRDDESPSALWQPILDLGPSAHYWVESFLNDWILQGPKASPSPHAFVERWRQLIEHSLTAPSWQDPEWAYRLDDLHYSLLGFDYGSALLENTEYEDALAILEPVLERWAPWLRFRRLATGFARFLASAGAKRLVVPGLQWLSQYAEVVCDGRHYYSDRLQSALVALLHHVWTEHRRHLEADCQFRGAFLHLLSETVRSHAPGALELHDHVLRTLPG